MGKTGCQRVALWRCAGMREDWSAAWASSVGNSLQVAPVVMLVLVSLQSDTKGLMRQ
jgi:hypothetical protein